MSTSSPADGYVHYYEDAKEYRISNINKLTQQSLPGQYLSLNAEECTSYAEGKLGFGINAGQVSMQTVGNIKNDMKTNKVDLDVLMLVDFFFENKLIDDMGKIFAENALGDPVDFERDTLSAWLERADRFRRGRQGLFRPLHLLDSLNDFLRNWKKNMFLTDVKLVWNPESRSYQSVGPIGIGNIGKRQVNVKVGG